MFLFPLYLLGAAALGIPLWVHLRNRQSSPPYRFPTLRFLAESSIVSERRKQILRWLVLILRLGALAALALAFAQPWLPAAVTPGSGAAVLVIDTSASMRSADVWTQARHVATAWLDQQPPGTLTAIVAIGRSPRVVAGFGDSADDQRRAVANLQPGFESTEPEAALRLAGRLLEQAPVSGKKLTVVSDFTINGWRDVDLDKPLPPGVKLEVKPIAPDAPANVAVTEIRTPRSFWSTSTPLEVAATVRNYARQPQTCEVVWRIGDRAVPQERLTLAAGETREVRFAVAPPTLATLRGSLELQLEDGLSADNTRYFAIPARKPLRVGYLAAQPGDAELFLQAAVEPAVDVASNRYKWVKLDPKSAEPLGKSIDLLLYEQGQSSPAVQQFVAEGGHVVVFLAGAAQLTDSETPWLPITIGEHRTREALAGPVHPAQLNFRHPILDPFTRPHGGDLFRIGVSRWRSFTSPTAEPLLRLSNGDPLLAVLSSGKSRVAVFAMPMRREWTDWPIQSTFLPLLHETLRWLSGDETRDSSLLVGDAGPDGRTTTLPGHAGDAAVNLDPRESDLARFTMIDRFQQLENPDKNLPAPAAAMMSVNPDSRRVTWWLLMGVAVFSLFELLLANRTPR